jgi:hypothetical protein
MIHNIVGYGCAVVAKSGSVESITKYRSRYGMAIEYERNVL